MASYDETEFEALVGKTLTEVRQIDNDEILFTADNGDQFKLYHSQDCCESVVVEDVVGDVADLIGAPILRAEERSSNDTPEGMKLEYEPESQTWTFYELATVKGSVTLRWHGTSNGYYSESVNFAAL